MARRNEGLQKMGYKKLSQDTENHISRRCQNYNFKIKFKEKIKFVIKIITTIIILAISYITWKLYKKSEFLTKELKKTTFALRSAYVKFGKTFEQFAPFTKNFTEDEKNGFIFLGCPIDGVIFGEDKIKFIEIKTGKSQLSSKQKKIKKMIEDGLVEFEEVRY